MASSPLLPRFPLCARQLWRNALAALWLLAALPAWAGESAPWTTLEPGLEYAEFDSGDESNAKVVALRFDPARFVFSLHTTSEEGGSALTLRQWADKYKLVAGINASMYLPDGSTSTGYMRNGGHVNNGRIAGRFLWPGPTGPICRPPPFWIATRTPGTRCCRITAWPCRIIG